MTALGSADADPGEIDTGRLSIGETRDGTAVGLPVAVINGAEDGPTVYIQAASDGDELNGVAVVTRLMRDLDPDEIAGEIHIVAIVNYFGYQVAKHRNPIDHTKLNRAYPGDPEGSSSERIAAATFEAAMRSDIALDLHQGSTSRMLDETRVRCGRHHELHEECLELARIYDCGYILDQQGPDGQLARALADEGIPAIDPELGGCVGWDEESIDIGVEGVMNVLRGYDLLDGEVSPQRQQRIAGFDQYHSPVGGLVEFACELGDSVDEGDTLGTIIDVFGREKERLVAEQDGIFWRTRRLPQVATGEYVCSVGIDVDGC